MVLLKMAGREMACTKAVYTYSRTLFTVDTLGTDKGMPYSRTLFTVDTLGTDKGMPYSGTLSIVDTLATERVCHTEEPSL